MNKYLTKKHDVEFFSYSIWYLRLLLLHRHASSFTDIKTIHGKEYNTYHLTS